MIIPKSRREVFSGRLRRQIGPILWDRCRHSGVELIGKACDARPRALVPEHPTASVMFVPGFLNGKSVVWIHRELLHVCRMNGLQFWAPGSCVSSVGLNEARVRQEIRELEEYRESARGVGPGVTPDDPDGAFPPPRPQGGKPHGNGPLGGPS